MSSSLAATIKPITSAPSLDEKRVAVRSGELVKVTIDPSFTVEPSKLIAMGYENLLPNNNYKSAFIKALRKAYGGNDKRYEKFNDKPESVQFALFLKERTENDLNLNKLMIATLDKLTGHVSFTMPTGEDAVAYDAIKNAILDAYEVGQSTLNNRQFRKLVQNVIEEKCYGFSIAKGSGFYFIDKRFDATRNSLTNLFNEFGSDMSLISFPMYDDHGSLAALKSAAKTDVMDTLEETLGDLQNDVANGTITRAKLENKQTQLNDLLNRATVLSQHLQEEAMEIMTKIKKIEQNIGKVTEQADELTFDFMAELKSVLSGGSK